MYLEKENLDKLGFDSVGENVMVSTKASFYSPEKITLGSNVRIDDFCILSPGRSLTIGNHVHMAAYCSIIGTGKVVLEDFVGLSGRVSIYSSTDDYYGRGMTNPTIPDELRNIMHGNIFIGKHSIIGAGSIILPNVSIGYGCSIYAQTLINSNCREFGIYSGNPANLIGKRSKKFLALEKDLPKYIRKN